MIISILKNFSIMFTFTVLSYFLFETTRLRRFTTYKEFLPFIIGVLATAISIILMKTSIPYKDSILGDLRNICILIAGLLGGPLAILLSSTLIGIFRIFAFDLSIFSLSIGLNLIVFGLILTLITYLKPMNLRNIHYYLLFTIIEITFSLIIFLPNTYDASDKFHIIFFFIVITIITFYITLAVLLLFHNQFTRTRKIEKLAETDFVTNLPNSRKFQEIAQLALMQQKEFSVLLIDIDQFKRFNRIHGHFFGDEILLLLANHLQNFANQHNAFAARTTGKHFYLLCHDAPPAMGIHLANLFILEVAARSFTLSNNTIVKITVSAGISSYPDNGHTIQDILLSAMHAKETSSSEDSISQINHENLLK